MTRILALVAAAVLLSACASGTKPREASAPQVLAPAQFQHAMKNGVLLDVRTPGEYADGHLAGARLIDIKSPDFDQRIAQLDKTKTYYVYCRSGGRSAAACEKLSALGIQCHQLEGGINAWNAAGLPTTRL